MKRAILLLAVLALMIPINALSYDRKSVQLIDSIPHVDIKDMDITVHDSVKRIFTSSTGAEGSYTLRKNGELKDSGSFYIPTYGEYPFEAKSDTDGDHILYITFHKPSDYDTYLKYTIYIDLPGYIDPPDASIILWGVRLVTYSDGLYLTVNTRCTYRTITYPVYVIIYLDGNIVKTLTRSSSDQILSSFPIKLASSLSGGYHKFTIEISANDGYYTYIEGKFKVASQVSLSVDADLSGNTLYLDITVSAATSVTLYIYVDGHLKESYSLSSHDSISTTITLSHGSHNIKVVAKDEYGQQASWEKTFFVNSPPSIEKFYVTTDIGKIIVKFKISDDESNVTARLYLNGELKKSSRVEVDREYTWSFDVSPGHYNVKLVAIDGSGAEDSAEKSVDVHGNSPPEIEEFDVYAGDNDVTVSLYIEDPNGDQIEVKIVIDGNKVFEDTYEGYANIYETFTVGYGEHTIYVYVKDSHGAETEAKKTVLCDPAPRLTVDFKADIVDAEITITIKVSDENDETVKMNLYINGQLDKSTTIPVGSAVTYTYNLPYGHYDFKIVVEDQFGKKASREKSIDFVPSPPEINVQYIISGRVLSLNITASDNYDEELDLYVYVNGELKYSGKIEVEKPEIIKIALEYNKTYEVEVKVVNSLGKEATRSQRVTAENVPPEITIISSNVHGKNLILRFTITDNGESSIKYKIFLNGSLIDYGTARNGSVIEKVIELDYRSYNITIVADDGYGGITKNSLTVSLENRPPKIENLSYEPVGARVIIKVRAIDPGENILTLKIFVNNTLVKTEEIHNDTDVEVALLLSNYGSYNITVVVEDGYGGFDRGVLYITIINKPPRLLIEDTSTYGPYISVAFKVIDPGEESIKISILVNGEIKRANSVKNNTLVHIRLHVGYGKLNLTFVADDGYGGITKKSIILTLTNMPPKIKIDIQNLNGSVKLSISVYDNDPQIDVAIYADDSLIYLKTVEANSTIELIPNLSIGEHNITVIATDEYGASSSEYKIVEVKYYYKPHIILIDYNHENKMVTITLKAYDEDDQTLFLKIFLNESIIYSSTIVVDRIYSLNITAPSYGSYSVTLKVIDSTGYEDEYKFMITVMQNIPTIDEFEIQKADPDELDIKLKVTDDEHSVRVEIYISDELILNTTIKTNTEVSLRIPLDHLVGTYELKIVIKDGQNHIIHHKELIEFKENEKDKLLRYAKEYSTWIVALIVVVLILAIIISRLSEEDIFF